MFGDAAVESIGAANVKATISFALQYVDVPKAVKCLLGIMHFCNEALNHALRP